MRVYDVEAVGQAKSARHVIGGRVTQETRVYDMPGNGPGRVCSQCHRVPFDSGSEGSKHVSMT